MKRGLSCVFAVILLAVGYFFMHGDKSLVPRSVLFGNPDRASVSLSRDGKLIAYLAPLDGVLNLHIANRETPTRSKAITNDRGSGIRRYSWTYDNKYLLYLQDSDGDENWQIYKVELSTLKAQNLTPFKGVLSHIVAMSEKHPKKIIVGLNKRNLKYFDLYEIDLNSGELKVFYQNDRELSSFILDEDYRIRFANKANTDGGQTIFEFDNKLALRPFMDIPSEDSITTYLVSLDYSGNILYLLDSRNRDTSALFAYDLKKKSRHLLFQDDKADISQILMQPRDETVQAVSVNYLRNTWYVLDDRIKEDINFLASFNKEEDMDVLSRTLDDKYWIISYISDNKPISYYIYDRAKQSLQFLFTNRANLEKYKLARMHPLTIQARDGSILVSYLTLPNEALMKQSGSQKNFSLKHTVPLVINVHGGPHARDTWGLNNTDQWLANRGYAVLNVNYRGSTGFGKEFVNKGNSEWAGKMHEDILDAAKWAVDSGIATPGKICIYGGSYGGYEALVGLTFTPDTFACGIDIVGPSNLTTLLKSIPPYWAAFYNRLLKTVGADPDTEDGRKFLLAKSPLSFAHQINKPLLIAHGANDPRVKQAESDQIVNELSKRNIPVTYLLYPDEGHGFVKPENRLSFYAIAEQFLAKIFKGKAEPIGNDLANSSIKILKGEDLVH